MATDKMIAPKWKKYRSSFYGSDNGQNVFRIGLRREVEDPKGRYWTASYKDGTMVQSADLHLPFDGIHRFETLRDAKWYLEVYDRD
jgi:hypothetical protein